MSWVLIVILVLIVLLVIYAIALYNGLVQKRNRVDNSWAQIDVQLKRRHDLIPNLVETVKGYAAHERGVFEAVTRARAAAVGAQGVAQTAAAEGMLTQALGRLFAVAEAYPDLKASHELPRPPEPAPGHRGQDRRLAPGLQRHGPHVQQRDPGLPRSPVAGALGFTKREFFEIEDAAEREVPVVSFQPAPPAVLPAAPSAGDAPTPPRS